MFFITLHLYKEVSLEQADEAGDILELDLIFGLTLPKLVKSQAWLLPRPRKSTRTGTDICIIQYAEVPHPLNNLLPHVTT